MKKYFILLLIAALMASFSACNKDDDQDPEPDPNPPADTTYNVEYKFEVNENLGNVKLVYYGSSNDRTEVENPTSPWEMSFTDFNKGDSVYFQYEIVPLVNTTLDYSYKIKITGGGIAAGDSLINIISWGDTIPPALTVHGSWAYLIE